MFGSLQADEKFGESQLAVLLVSWAHTLRLLHVLATFPSEPVVGLEVFIDHGLTDGEFVTTLEER